jgi:hypothetical protein
MPLSTTLQRAILCSDHAPRLGVGVLSRYRPCWQPIASLQYACSTQFVQLGLVSSPLSRSLAGDSESDVRSEAIFAVAHHTTDGQLYVVPYDLGLVPLSRSASPQ